MGARARGLQPIKPLWVFLSPAGKASYLRKLRFLYVHREELLANPNSELFDHPDLDFGLTQLTVELLLNMENIEELYSDVLAFDDLRIESASV